MTKQQVTQWLDENGSKLMSVMKFSQAVEFERLVTEFGVKVGFLFLEEQGVNVEQVKEMMK